jgi:hypothetical protein
VRGYTLRPGYFGVKGYLLRPVQINFSMLFGYPCLRSSLLGANMLFLTIFEYGLAENESHR